MVESAPLSVTVGGALDSRLYPARPLLAVSLAVFRAGHVLLARRVAAPMAGRFTLPGGLVEPGETLAEAARRETREEVGVEAEIVGFNDHVEVIEQDADGRVARHYVIASFVGRWRSGEGASGPEADGVIWAGPDALDDLPVTDHLPPLLASARALLARVSS